MNNVLVALLFFSGGLAFSYVNYLVSGFLLKSSNSSMILPLLRNIVNIGVLVLAYFLGQKLEMLGAVLIGTAIGLTIPGFLFSYRISKKLLEENEKEKQKKDGE